MTWTETTLGDLITLQRGYDLPSKNRVPGPVPVLSAGEKISYHNEAKVAGPGFVIGRSTNLGIPRWSDEDFWPLNTTLFAKDFKGNNPRWLFYLFQILDLSGFDSGTAQGSLNRNYIGSFRVLAPDRNDQDRIVDVIGSLDDKIAANQKAILQLDKLRHALWQRNLQAGAFPKPLSSLASFVNGGAFTKNATGTGRVVVRIAELTGGIGRSTVRNVLDVPDNQVVRNGDLLFSWSGTLMVKRWPLGEAIVNQHIFKVVPDRDFPAVFLDCAIDQQLEYFKMIAAGKATTMGHIKRSDLDAEVEIPVQIREDDLKLSSSLWDTAVSLEKEIVSLSKTRDELLPLLMSGKISVKEAEQEAAAAGAEVQSEKNEA